MNRRLATAFLFPLVFSVSSVPLCFILSERSTARGRERPLFPAPSRDTTPLRGTGRLPVPRSCSPPPLLERPCPTEFPHASSPRARPGPGGLRPGRPPPHPRRGGR